MRTGSWPSAVERVDERRDRDVGVEFGAVLLAHAHGEIVGAQVVSEPDAHLWVRYSAAIARVSRASVPSGSG